MKSVPVIVKSFSLGDCEDPEIYAAQPLWEWQNSEQGKWVMENSISEVTYNMAPDVHTYGFKVYIRAEFTEKDATFFSLKWK